MSFKWEYKWRGRTCLFSIQTFQSSAFLSSLAALLFQEPQPRIAFTSLRLSWHRDRPWEARIHSVLILSPTPIGFDWPQHIHSSPNSTANKSLSSDTIQEKKFAQGAQAQTLSVFRPWSISVLSPLSLSLFFFQSADAWHERIDMPVAQTVMKTVMFVSVLMVRGTIIKLDLDVSFPFSQAV